MTERTIRTLAKELASVFYEEAGGDLFGTAPEDRARSKRFRSTFPTLKHYLEGMAVAPDGRIVPQQKAWTYFVSLARARMVQMLSQPGIGQSVKEGIYKALLEEHEKSTSPAAQEILQRRLGHGPSLT